MMNEFSTYIFVISWEWHLISQWEWNKIVIINDHKIPYFNMFYIEQVIYLKWSWNVFYLQLIGQSSNFLHFHNRIFRMRFSFPQYNQFDFGLNEENMPSCSICRGAYVSPKNSMLNSPNKCVWTNSCVQAKIMSHSDSRLFYKSIDSIRTVWCNRFNVYNI